MPPDRRPYRLHWLSTLPTPYNDCLFHELCGDSEFDLVVHYRMRSSASHPWQMGLARGYEARFYSTMFGVDWQVLRIAMCDPRAFFVVGAWNHPTAVLLINFLAVTGRRFALWTDTPNLRRKRNTISSFFRSAWLRWVFTRVSKAMGTGRPGGEALRKMGVSADKIVNLPYFVPITDYDPVLKQRRDDSPLVLISVGRLVKSDKGFDIALEALGRVKAISGIPRFEYVICGTGPDEEKLKSLAEELNLAENVKFTGWLEPEDVTAALQRAHILLHPAPWEPYGVVVLEAMINGVVVLASDGTCAALDRISSGVNGFIHPVGDVAKIVEHLTLLFNDGARLTRMGLAARRTAEEWPASRGVAIIRSALLS